MEIPHIAAGDMEVPFQMAEALELLESPLCYNGLAVWYLFGPLRNGPWPNQFKQYPVGCFEYLVKSRCNFRAF